MAPRADNRGTPPPGGTESPRAGPLPRGIGDGARQRRHHRQTPVGTEVTVPRRGRGRSARAVDGRAQEVVRKEQSYVRTASSGKLPPSLFLAGSPRPTRP